MKNVTRSERIFIIVSYILLGLLAVVTIVPLLSVLITSFVSASEIARRGQFILWPEVWDTSAYGILFKTDKLYTGYANTLFVVIVGTALSMFLTITLAYPLSKRELRGRNGILGMVFFTMLFSGGMVPSYILVMNILDLGNTFWALWLPGAMSAFNMIIIKNYFQGLPNELEEAAIIDGSNDLITFVRIILPLSTPVLASVALFYAVGHWNSYFNAMMYISDPDMELMTIVLRRMVFLTNKITQDSTFDWGAAGMPPAKSIKMATTVVATVPMLCIYPFVQKYFTQGIMVGSVKG